MIVEILGKVLTLDYEDGLAVSEVNPKRRVPLNWKWIWGPDGHLVNVGRRAMVGFDDDSEWYFAGRTRAKFEIRKDLVYPNEFAQSHLVYD